VGAFHASTPALPRNPGGQRTAGARPAMLIAGNARWNVPCDAETCGRLPRIGARTASRKELRRRAVEVTGGGARFRSDRREKTMVEAAFSNSPRDAFEEDLSFACCLRRARRRLDVKQACLSVEIGCSAAALSFWEAGHRFPTLSNLRRLLRAMSGAGATAAEQLALREAWSREKSRSRPVLPSRGVEHASRSSEQLGPRSIPVAGRFSSLGTHRL
jgi:hypothetical protein